MAQAFPPGSFGRGYVMSAAAKSLRQTAHARPSVAVYEYFLKQGHPQLVEMVDGASWYTFKGACPVCATGDLSTTGDTTETVRCTACDVTTADAVIDAIDGTGPDGIAKPKPLRVKWLSEYEPRAVDWLWRDRIPCAELTVLAGDGGFGKSTFAAHLTGEIASGRVTGGTGTRRVLVVLGEDDPDRVLTGRYEGAAADPQLVGVVSDAPDDHEAPITLPDDLDRLRATVLKHRPDLLVIDPLSVHLSGDVDSNRDGGRGGLRQVLNPLSRLAQTTGTAVLVIVHLNKGNGPAGQRLGGTAGLRNAARNVLMLVPHPDHRETGEDDGRRVLGHEKCNYGRRQPTLDAVIRGAPVTKGGRPLLDKDGAAVTAPVLQVRGESDVDYERALHAASDGERDDGVGGKYEAAVEFVKSALAQGPVPVADLKSDARGAGHAWRTVERAFGELAVKSAKVGSVWVRELPDGGLGGHDEIPLLELNPGPSDGPPESNSATPVRPGGVGGVDPKPPCADRHGEFIAPHPETGRPTCTRCHPFPVAA